jgi:hypothetical protein
MDKTIKQYQQIIKTFLQEECAGRAIPGIDSQVIIDPTNHHLQLVEAGWYDKTYIYAVVYHFRIKPDGKVWLLANNSDVLVAEELIKRGIPASAIVIGFHPVHVRQFTHFATA